ncbi:DUF4124 domain-containing protein [Luteibacter aegosomatissinici]|uniref:DUF4124 domain-containing protein n=1 Tax=Luteibacter aegosomatissinici TaxID=2911539 RepID=UPI001FF7CE49|nr:DUF4124 domain-containing protein [Luteibacter aegosomatissinici]UPG93422.1 DUF4124 domain-containing protein [Luteibacter aegosomatissinici]
MRRCIAILLLAAVCPLAFAQAYKWKDAQGVTHYSDSPPPTNSAKVEKIQMKGGVNAPSPAQSAPAKSSTAGSPPPGTPVADNPANRAKLCDSLRKNMDVLQKEAVVSMDDGKGGTKQLDAAGRQRQVETTQAQMTLYCKS